MRLAFQEVAMRRLQAKKDRSRVAEVVIVAIAEAVVVVETIPLEVRKRPLRLTKELGQGLSFLTCEGT
jgi:hypothetical protein